MQGHKTFLDAPHGLTVFSVLTLGKGMLWFRGERLIRNFVDQFKNLRGNVVIFWYRYARGKGMVLVRGFGVSLACKFLRLSKRWRNQENIEITNPCCMCHFWASFLPGTRAGWVPAWRGCADSRRWCFLLGTWGLVLGYVREQMGNGQERISTRGMGTLCLSSAPGLCSLALELSLAQDKQAAGFAGLVLVFF